MADKSVTLPELDWNVIEAALYELPVKMALPVLQRLQPQIRPAPPVELRSVPKEASDG